MGCMYRLAEEEDIPVLMSLIKELTDLEEDFDYNPGAHKDGLKMLLGQEAERATVIVAVSDGMVVGMCTGQVVASTAVGKGSVWVEDVVVAEEYRGMGIGKGLLKGVEHWAKEYAGAGRLQLVTDKENEAAQGFCKGQEWGRSNSVVLRKEFVEKESFVSECC